MTRLVAVLILIIGSLIGSTTAALGPIEGLNIYEMGEKEWSLKDCMPKTKMTSRQIPSKPDCSAIPKASTQREPLVITFWKPVLTLKQVEAELCREVTVTTETYVTIWNQKKIQKTRVELSIPDPKQCARVRSGDIPQEPSSIPHCDEQYFKVTPLYSYFSHTTHTDKVYCLSKTEINVDIDVGLIMAPDGQRHQCKYDDGYCTMKEAGTLYWPVQKSITKLEHCPYIVHSHEVCTGNRGAEGGRSFLAVSCPSSKTRLHIGSGAAGKIRPKHIEQCQKVTMMVKTQEGLIVSFNYSSSDPSDLMNVENTPQSLLTFYSLKRLTCTEGKGNICTSKKEAPFASQNQTISGVNDDICYMGLCKLNPYHQCGGTIINCMEVGVEADQMTFQDLAGVQGEGGICVSIEKPPSNQVCVHKGDWFVKKPTSSKLLYNLVEESGAYHTGFSYRGYTRVDGVRCKRVGMVGLANTTSYRGAVDQLITTRSNDYTWYSICLKFGTGQWIEAAQTTEPSPDKSDFVLKWTGKRTSGAMTGSYLESQLSFLYNALNTRSLAEMHAIEVQLCYEARANWIMQEGLREQNTDLYVQSLLTRETGDREYAGYVKGRTVYYWECPAITKFALQNQIEGANCTERPVVKFWRNGTLYQGFLQMESGRIVSSPGRTINCAERENHLSVGFGMTLLFNSSGYYLVTERQRSVFPPADEYIVPNLGLEDIGEIMKEVSLSNQVEDLAEIVLNNINRGVLEPPMWQFVNTSNGMVEKIKRVKMPRFELFDLSSLLVMLGLIILIMGVGVACCCCCGCPSCTYKASQAVKIVKKKTPRVSKYEGIALVEMGAKKDLLPKRRV